MNTEKASQLLLHTIAPYNDVFAFHPRFVAELLGLTKDLPGQEKQLFKLLAKQLNAIRTHDTRIHFVDNHEILRSGNDVQLYAIHLSLKGAFNIRLIIAFLSDLTALFLVAFNEKAGKSRTNYTNHISKAKDRYSEMTEEVL